MNDQTQFLPPLSPLELFRSDKKRIDLYVQRSERDSLDLIALRQSCTRQALLHRLVREHIIREEAVRTEKSNDQKCVGVGGAKLRKVKGELSGSMQEEQIGFGEVESVLGGDDLAGEEVICGNVMGNVSGGEEGDNGGEEALLLLTLPNTGGPSQSIATDGRKISDV